MTSPLPPVTTSALRQLLKSAPTLLTATERSLALATDTPPEQRLSCYQTLLQRGETWLRRQQQIPFGEALKQLQELYREQEQWLQQRSSPLPRHHFTLIIPVADRPHQLRRCLESLLQLCHTFHYGIDPAGRFAQLQVMIADDSCDRHDRQQIEEICDWLEGEGIDCNYFGRKQQQQLYESLTPESSPLRQTATSEPRPPATSRYSN